jgi:hypothetical protein
MLIVIIQGDITMLGTGNMMHMPLLISSILTHAVENNPEQEIVTALDNGELTLPSGLRIWPRDCDSMGYKRASAWRH